jgi:hypothetical protein
MAKLQDTQIFGNLDVDGELDLRSNLLTNFRIETRTNDPSSPKEGRMWIRTDL